MAGMTIEMAEFSETLDTYLFIAKSDEILERREMAGYASGDAYTLKDTIDLTTGDTYACIRTFDGMTVVLAVKKSTSNFYLVAYNEFHMAYKMVPSSSGANLVDGVFSASGRVSVALADIRSNHFTFVLPKGNCKLFVSTNYYECAVCRPGYYLDGTLC